MISGGVLATDVRERLLVLLAAELAAAWDAALAAGATPARLAAILARRRRAIQAARLPRPDRYR